jgi:L-cysteine:1D-myo-inositol 2-amino-2-deoxy-alpha-D-glucopyranoside ligase
MRLYNALTRQIETFKPIKNEVTVYVCGITPYDTTHLGHGFTYAVFDILIRYLEFLGYQVRYVQNVTDIDDDILRKAKEVGDNWLSLGNRWTTHFVDDNVALNIRPPDFFPRASEVISEIVASVQALLSAGVAYESGGNVYFQIAADPDYGKLSRLSHGEMLPLANERGNNPDDPHKRDPLDFVLWQAQSPGEPAWESPWGLGRPGWHIECSTMAGKYLGQPIDLHGGGEDLIYPHHESEIAQAECATGDEPFSRFWIHVAMVRYQGEKMSKSIGNLVMVRDLLETGYPADALRLYLASHHYRQAWNYDEGDLKGSEILANQFRESVSLVGGNGEALDPTPAELDFRRAMDDDLNTRVALDALSRLAGDIISSAGAGLRVQEAQASLRTMCGILGLRLDQQEPESRVIAGWAEHRRRFAS